MWTACKKGIGMSMHSVMQCFVSNWMAVTPTTENHETLSAPISSSAPTVASRAATAASVDGMIRRFMHF
jgi:hypothetical protein